MCQQCKTCFLKNYLGIWVFTTLKHETTVLWFPTQQSLQLLRWRTNSVELIVWKIFVRRKGSSNQNRLIYFRSTFVRFRCPYIFKFIDTIHYATFSDGVCNLHQSTYVITKQTCASKNYLQFLYCYKHIRLSNIIILWLQSAMPSGRRYLIW